LAGRVLGAPGSDVCTCDRSGCWLAAGDLRRFHVHPDRVAEVGWLVFVGTGMVARQR